MGPPSVACSRNRLLIALALAFAALILLYNQSVVDSMRLKGGTARHSVDLARRSDRFSSGQESSDGYDDEEEVDYTGKVVDVRKEDIPEPEESEDIAEAVDNSRSEAPKRLSDAEKNELMELCKSRQAKNHPGVGNGPRIQYIHNPKSGGTSIQMVLWKFAKKHDGASYSKFDGNEVLGSSYKCPGRSQSKTVLAGHRGFGFCKDIEFSPRGIFTIMNFRDSVSRMVSYYDYYLYQLRESRAVKVYGSLNKSFKDIVKMYDSTEEIEYGEALIRYSGQQQARFLCGYDCMGPIARANKTHTEEYILNRALQNLKKLDIIGITEELDNMAFQLHYHLPHLIPPGFHSFPRDNRASKKSAIDDETRTILRRWGWVDATLYEEAKKIYQKKHVFAKKCLEVFKGSDSDQFNNNEDPNEFTEEEKMTMEEETGVTNAAADNVIDAFGPVS